MELTEVKEYSSELHEALNSLLPQLSSSAQPLEPTDLRNIIGNDAVHLLVAHEGNTCLGTLSLVTFPILTGIRAWIEDVVVSEDARGKGVGKLLTNRAIEIATECGATTIDLTSRPSREAANRLYRSVGFEERVTNVYRVSIGSKQ